MQFFSFLVTALASVFGSLHLFKSLKSKTVFLAILAGSTLSCASTVKWSGKLNDHAKDYMETFSKFRSEICVPKAESVFDTKLKSYRGAGYWIPELGDDVDTETIKSLLPEMEKKLEWIRSQKTLVQKSGMAKPGIVKHSKVLLKKLLALKKSELSVNEDEKKEARQKSLKLLDELKNEYASLVKELSYFTNYKFPVDHLRNRKAHEQVREKTDIESEKMANYAFLYRKILEDGTYLKDHSSSDVYFRTTLDTLHFELKEHDFYLTEDARYDLDFVLKKIEAELEKGQSVVIERLEEWEERTQKSYSFYQSLTLPENKLAGRQLIKEHNIAAEDLKAFVYKKQAEVYRFWLNQSELERAIFVLETILLNEVGGVDGDEALERMDVARVVMNRLDKPRYLAINKKEFIYSYLVDVTSENTIKNEKWLNALFKQGEFSFTYYYMAHVSKIFCPDMGPLAKKLRTKNVQIALQALKEENSNFKATRYFSRASMIGRIHMDSIWEDYVPYPERPGLLLDGQDRLLKKYNQGDYTYLYSFTDPENKIYQILEIDSVIYALNENNGLKLFYQYRNPHFFRYFSR